jgi:hypothetical protein
LECGGNLVLINIEADITNPESVGGITSLITVCLGPRLKFIFLITSIAGCCKVDIDLTTIKISALFGGMGLSGISSIGEFNVTKARESQPVYP